MGAENPFASEKIKETIRLQNIERYGVEYPQQRQEVREKLKKNNIEKYGYEYTLQIPEIRKSIEKTNLSRYGFRCSAQNHEVRMKQARSANQSKVARHWFSGEDIVCQGSCEYSTVIFLNSKYIDYLWQVQTFVMPDGRVYTPDFYLPDSNIWVEVKGYFFDDALEKCDWFQTIKPNSELWNKEKLKEMGVI